MRKQRRIERLDSGCVAAPGDQGGLASPEAKRETAISDARVDTDPAILP